MSKRKIEQPRVFISYAWGTEEYQNKVLSFATQLMGDGIDVVFDKWDLTEGNDTYAFMKKCASDESITNVLMLLDTVYATKADEHKGGVGTETQIISAKVYQEVTQDKFIPIVFERNEKNEICKPVYLQGRLHFDLTDAERYDYEYLRLVKKLYGEEVYEKPPIGSRPAWVDQKNVISVKKKNNYDAVKSGQSAKIRKEMYRKYIEETMNSVKRLAKEQEERQDVDILLFYKEYEVYRDEYLELLELSFYVEDAEQVIASFLENLYIWLDENQQLYLKLGNIFLHEIFLYTVAYYLKKSDYVATGYILQKTYYGSKSYRVDDMVSAFTIFYAGDNDVLSNAMKERDQKKYINGTAAYWIQNIAINYYTKEQFLLADLVCFNYSIYGKEYLSDWYWFPVTYIYDNRYNSVLRGFSVKLVSEEHVAKILPLLGYEKKDELISRFKEIKEEKVKGTYRNWRYHESFEAPCMFDDFVENTKIATVK